MQLREIIAMGIEKTQSRNALANAIGVVGQQITDAKAGRQKLPTAACGRLAEIVGIDRWTVVAASEYITEKDATRHAYLAQFVEETQTNAATKTSDKASMLFCNMETC